jgi:threonine synthase
MNRHTPSAAAHASGEGGALQLECTGTGERYDPERPWGLSPAGKPLFARYDLEAIRTRFSPDAMAGRRADLWRYAEVLPVRDASFRVTLGEGWTPLLEAPRLGRRLGIGRCRIKDEAQNPTGSFKARGMALAVSRALELGARVLAVPSAGNAGSDAAAYAAAAGVPVHVVVPSDTPAPLLEEIEALGARLHRVDGLITDCGKHVARGVREEGWFDLSTLKEPYRVEGKKTMAYELFEQLDGRLPDAIVYPTGGGTGLVGMWKAFAEMETLGWIGPERPRMYSVQATGCAPIVRAFDSGRLEAGYFEGARTYASGLRVPSAVGDFLVLRALRESGGAAVAVTDRAMAAGVQRMGADAGVFAAPEGGATVAAVERLRETGRLRPDDDVVLFNTGTGLKYVGMEPLDEEAGS